MTRRLHRRSVVTGQITLPAAPGMVDEYVTMCENIFADVGRRFTAEQLAHVKTVLEGQLAEAYAAPRVRPSSSRSTLPSAPSSTTTSQPNGGRSRAPTRTGSARSSPPLFGTEPDAQATIDDLRRDYQLILLSEVVSDFRTAQQLRGIFELAAQCLGAGGRLVFNAFLARPGYLPDDAARELGQQGYTSIFTQQEMGAAASGLPLRLVADDSVYEYEYEYAHLPEGAWPPTSWYADWVSNLDVFDLRREECPIEMRWLVYQKPNG
jgi:hypothetical protein